MAFAINMPQIGQDIQKGVIVEWYVKEGDRIKKGDIIAAVESDKAVFEVEAFESGTLLQILFQPGQEAEVFKPIAYGGEPGEVIRITETDITKGVDQQLITDAESKAKAGTTASSKELLVSPAAKRMAREHKLSLSEIKGSGPNGRIIKKDILQLIDESNFKTGVSTVPEDQVIPFSKMRKSIATRLKESKQNIPHYYLYKQINVSKLLPQREEFNEKHQVHVSINDLIVYSVARALKIFPKLNSHVINDNIILRGNINIGMAVSVEGGLLVPVIPDADQKRLIEISKISAEIVSKAQQGILQGSSPGTFTITNLGMHGISHFQAIINPPESAILSVGCVEKKVVSEMGGILFADCITFGLACDHRVIDGAYGAQFLDHLSGFVETLNIETDI